MVDAWQFVDVVSDTPQSYGGENSTLPSNFSIVDLLPGWTGNNVYGISFWTKRNIFADVVWHAFVRITNDPS